MALTARFRTNSVRPLSIDSQVPRNEHFDWRHRVYWKGHARTGTEARHLVLDLNTFSTPCLRRWNEWKGYHTPKYTVYTTVYSPPCIQPKPEYHWTLYDDTGIPVASFTNVVEAYYIVIGAKMFGNLEFKLEYKDHSSPL